MNKNNWYPITLDADSNYEKEVLEINIQNIAAISIRRIKGKSILSLALSATHFPVVFIVSEHEEIIIALYTAIKHLQTWQEVSDLIGVKYDLENDFKYFLSLKELERYLALSNKPTIIT